MSGHAIMQVAAGFAGGTLATFTWLIYFGYRARRQVLRAMPTRDEVAELADKVYSMRSAGVPIKGEIDWPARARARRERATDE